MKVLDFNMSNAQGTVLEEKERISNAMVTAIRELDHATSRMKEVLSGGWRCVVEAGPTEKPTFIRLDAQEQNGGSWALAKINTMKHFEKYQYATRPMSMAELRSVAIDLKGESAAAKWRGGILAHGENDRLVTDYFGKKELSWLTNTKTDGLGIAPGFGGITIPYAGRMIHGNNSPYIEGQIRIAFSGGTQEQDLFFAVSMLKALLFSAKTSLPNALINFDLTHLREIPQIVFWLELIGM